MLNIASALQKMSSQFQNQCAYLFLEDGEEETSQLTYGELDRKARILADYLLQKKLTNKRMLLLYPPGIDFVIAFFGCLYAGVIAVPVNCPREDELEKSKAFLHAIALDGDIAGVFTTKAFLSIVKSCFQDLSQQKKCFIAETTHFIKKEKMRSPLPKIKGNTIAYLQYTSGSTSTPKAAIITHQNLSHSLKSTGKIWAYSKNSITLNWAPHTHVYGLVCGILLPIYYGGMAILVPPAIFIQKPITWLNAISKYKVTHSGCPNFGYDICIRDITPQQLHHIDLQSWQVAVNGGEQVQAETLKSFCEKFASVGFKPNQFCSAYGMSELSGAISSTSYQKAPAYFKFTSVGLPNRTLVSSGYLIPGLHAVIVDPHTLSAVADEKIGEIWLSGKSLVSGYWGREEETKAVFNVKLGNSTQSYFRTGDLGFLKEGELYLMGRLKEQIVLYGKKYYPLDLEMTVSAVIKPFKINNTRAIFSVSIENKEQLILIEEINNELEKSKIDEMITRVRHDLMKHHGVKLDEIVLVSEHSIPKTTSGKLNRKLCQDQYLLEQLSVIYRDGKTPHPPSRLSEQSDQQLLFIQLVSSVLKINEDKVDLLAPLSQYAFDSIHIIKLTGLINEKYGLNVTPAILFNYHRLADFFNDYLAKQPVTQFKTTTPSELMNDDIAIIGISGLFPGAQHVDIFWNNLIEGKDAITEIPSDRFNWRTIESSNQWGGFIDHIAQFDAPFFNISPREAELIDPQQRLFLQTAWRAIEDAGYATVQLSQMKTGLFVGAFTNDYAELLQQHDITDAYITTGLSHAILANRVSYLLNLQGPSEAIDTGCSSSLVAIHHAVSAIKQGDCEIAIVGGVNALVTPTLYVSANKAGMLSQDGRCKTFDEKANGYVRGEGIAAMLLKPLSKAKADHDHIYAIIKGTAVNHGGHVNSLTVPNPNAQADVIVSACERAGIEVESIQYIETHGTGTSLGDPVEVNGLKKAFNILAKQQGKKDLPAYFCGLGSVKTHIGHLEAAAGIAGVIKVLLAMQHKVLPKNLHFEILNPYIEIKDSPFYLVNETQLWPEPKNNWPRRAGVSSFGFGGTNAHIVLEEAPHEEKLSLPLNSHPYLIALSAKTKIALMQRISDLHQWLTQQKQMPSLAALSYTLNAGRDHFDKRCILVVQSIQKLKEILNQVLLGNYPENFYTNAEEKNQCSFNCAIASSMRTLCEEYMQGKNINWEALHVGEKKRLSLPTYPFAKDNYWIEPTFQKSVPSAQLNNVKSVSGMDVSLIRQDLINIVSEIVKVSPENINTTESLSNQGFDSIAFAELALSLEEHYGIQLNPTLFFTYHTILDLSQYLWDNNFVAVHAHPIPANIVASKERSSEPIAIIGMQGIFPQSQNITKFCEQLFSGKDMVTEIPKERWDWQHYFGDAKNDPTKTNSKWGGFLPDVQQFDAGFFNISAREANLMDPQQRLMLEVAWKTIEDAGYDPYALAKHEVGVFIGAEFSDYEALIATQSKIFHGHLATGNAHTMLANRISYFLNLQGPSEVIDTACSSSLVAINRAVNAIHCKECDVAIVGGVSIILNPDIFVITTQLGALSPDGRCKTFDKNANGYVKGEGVAAILLKPLREALHEGDHIYGVIQGSAVNHGGKAQSLTAPNAKSQSQLLIKAYNKAGIHPDTISYIETHGTGTPLGDPIEIEGLKQAFNHFSTKKNVKPYCGIGSVKSHIGHLEPASGIAGVIKVLLAMQEEKLPGNLHFTTLNPFIELVDSPFFVVDKTQDWLRLKDHAGKDMPRRAGISSFGFGGTNAHLVIEEAPAPKALNSQAPSKPYYLLTLSAKSEISLQQKIADLHDWLKDALSRKKSMLNLESLCFTLNKGRTHFNYRCAIVINSLEELLLSLHALINHQTLLHCIIHDVPIANLYEPLLDEIYFLTIATIKDYKNVSAEIYKKKLLLLGDLYTRRYPIDWDIIHTDEQKQRLAALPAYPFIKTRYWFDAELHPSTCELASITKDFAARPTDIPREGAGSRMNKITDVNYFTLQYLKNIFSEKLNLPVNQINEHATYEVFGVDSLLGLEIIKRLENDFGVLSKTLLYEKNKIVDLAIYFQQKNAHVLEKLLMQTPEQRSFEDQSRVDKNTPVNQMAADDIAIIGLTGAYPLAQNIDEFWTNLLAGKDCITEIPIERWDYQDHPVMLGEDKKYYQHGGFLPDVDKFDPLFFNIAPRDAELMDPQERLFMQSAWELLENAGYHRETLKRTVNNNVGVFVGATHHFYPLLLAEAGSKENQLPLGIQLFSIANRVSYFFNLNGPSFVIDTACSSSLAAIHLACESIARGECLMAIAGGVNLSLHPRKYHMLGTYGFLSDKGQCASFSADGSGYVPSEGVGAVLLKPLSLALKDNDYIYGIIKGSSMNHGGKTSGYTVPNPNAQAALIKNALAKAQINPRTISYIEAHGTGTVLGDPIEIRGLQEAFTAFTQDKQFCAVGSVKSNIGHLEAAAGISQLTKVLLQMKHKKLVPSIHAQDLNPYIHFSETAFFVQRELTDWQAQKDYPRRAGISSFGAGGTNVHLIVEEFAYASSQQKQIAFDSWIFILSALNAERLHAYAEKMYTYFLNQKQCYPQEIQLKNWLTQVCYTLQMGREPMKVRLAIKANSYDDLLQQLKVYLEKKSSGSIHLLTEMADITHEGNADKLMQYWLDGYQVPWENLYHGNLPQRTAVPTYPFEKRRCWVPIEETKNVSMSSISEPEIVISRANRNEVMQLLLKIVSPLLGLAANEIEHDMPFQHYGLDSMIGMHFVAELGEHYSDLISPMDLYRYPTLNQLADYIAVAYQPPVAADEESQFLDEIAHLNNQEVIELLENEYRELENLM